MKCDAPIRFFSEEQIERILTPQKTTAAMEAAFKRDYRQTIQMPLRTQMESSPGSLLLLMPCYDRALSAAGMKIVTVTTLTQVNADRIRASFLLLDPDTGKVKAIMGANYLTDVRTAAVSAVATKLMSRPDASILGVFGTGRQALAHVLVLSCVSEFSRILVCGSSLSRSEEFAQQLWSRHKVKVEPVDNATCASAADVICTCTTSRTPLFDGGEVRDGTHLNLVGGFQPDTREVDSYLMRRARIVVDTYQGALAEAGELLIPLRQGELARECISADLHEIASGKKTPRSNPQEVTVFKSVGCAFQDLVIAKLVWDQLTKPSPRSS